MTEFIVSPPPKKKLCLLCTPDLFVNISLLIAWGFVEHFLSTRSCNNHQYQFLGSQNGGKSSCMPRASYGSSLESVNGTCTEALCSAHTGVLISP